MEIDGFRYMYVLYGDYMFVCIDIDRDSRTCVNTMGDSNSNPAG